MSGDGCCCHDLERERIGASELEDAYAEAMGALNRVTAQRDAARNIAARLEGELAEVKVYLRGLRDRLRMDEVDAQGVGNFIAARAQVTMLTRVIADVDAALEGRESERDSL